MEVEVGDKYIHLSSGYEYTVCNIAVDVINGSKFVVYTNFETIHPWLRPIEDFQKKFQPVVS